MQYRSNVVLDAEGHVASHALAPVNDADGYVWDHPAVRVYCENDHPVAWRPPAVAEAAWPTGSM